MKNADVLTSRASALRSLERGALRPYGDASIARSRAWRSVSATLRMLHLGYGAQFVRYVLGVLGKVHDGVNLNRSLCSGN